MLNDKGENLTGPGSCALPRVGPDGSPRLLEGLCRPGLAVQSDFAVPLLRSVESSPLSLRSFLKGPYYTLVKLRRSPCACGAAESQKEGGGGARAGWGGGGGEGGEPALGSL